MVDTFAVRAIVEVMSNAPRDLGPYVGSRGIVLYLTGYTDNVPAKAAVLIGGRVVDVLEYQKTGRIHETIGGTMKIIPLAALEKRSTIERETPKEGRPA